MKNKVVLIVLTVAIVLLLLFTIFGFKIGKIEVLSISKIVNKNKEINSQIDSVSQLTSVTYPQSISTLETTINNLKTQKEKYEEIADLEDGEEGILETEKYDITYLWTTLGKLAPKYNIKMSIDVKKTSGTELYDLSFNIQGEYVKISSFIKKIEDDSSLKVRIDNFKLSGSGEELTATFTVKNIRIDEKTLIKNSNTTVTENNQENGNNSQSNGNNNNNNSNTATNGISTNQNNESTNSAVNQ